MFEKNKTNINFINSENEEVREFIDIFVELLKTDKQNINLLKNYD